MKERPFLMRAWYVVARSAEVRPVPLARWICGLPLVLFRRADNRPAALLDRCPHRKYPLSEGEVIGDDIQCGYHGIRFGSDGACVHIPTQDTIPPGFGVRAFPVAERAGLVYAWMGEPAAADPATIPDFHENADPAWAATPDYLHLDANWQLVVDNLLDLTHLTFVHKTTLASSGIQENPLVVSVERDGVRARREMRDVEPAPIFRTMRAFKGNIDRFQNIRFLLPSHVHIRVEACPTGAVDDPDLVHHVVMNHLTPETERTTHYFWSIARRMKINDPTISDLLHRMNRTAFEEDVGILSRQQRMMEFDRDDEPFVNLTADKAVNEARRLIRQRLREEAYSAPALEQRRS